jgi:hypothetical protein
MKARSTGSYPTPFWLARELVVPALLELGRGRSPGQIGELRILEPAVGDGVLLVAALEGLELAYLRAGGDPARLGRFRHGLTCVGVDRDPAAVGRARARLAARGVPGAGLVVGDALSAVDLAGAGTFHLVASNPPFVSARVAAAAGQDRQALIRRYRTARGAFDIAAAFVERSLELLAPGGRLAVILPRSLCATLHGRPLRQLLTTRATVTDLIDVSHRRPFGPRVAVYPLLLRALRRRPRSDDRVCCGALGDPAGWLDHSELAALVNPGFPVGVDPAAAREARARQAAGVPLQNVAEIFAMTAGFAARSTARQLRERAETEADAVPFVTTGSIRPFRVRAGPVRYQRQRWQEPVLLPGDRSREHRDRRPKLLVAGMARQLRAAWCPTAMAGGVNLYGVAPATDLDPFLLLGCLNAPCLTELYGSLYPGKRLGGGYLAVNRHSLGALPVVRPGRPEAQAIAGVARHLHECQGEDAQALRELDELVRLGLS